MKEEAAQVKRSARDGRSCEALLQLAQAAVHLARAEAPKAAQVAKEAQGYFQREQEWAKLLEVLEARRRDRVQRYI